MSRFAWNGNRIDFNLFDPVKVVKVLSDANDKSMRGTLDRINVGVTPGILFTEYLVSTYLTPLKMDILFPLMGLPETPTDTFTLGDSLSGYDAILGMQGAKEETYVSSFCVGWRVHGRKGGDPVELILRMVSMGLTEQNAGTFFTSQTSPAMVEGYPFEFTSGTMTILGSTRSFNQFSIGLDYMPVVEYNNSLTPTNICPTDHKISIGTGVLFSTCDGTGDLFTTPLAGLTGSSFLLNLQHTIAAANYQTQFSVPSVEFMPRPPRVTKHDFNRLPVQMTGMATASTKALIVTNKNAEA